MNRRTGFWLASLVLVMISRAAADEGPLIVREVVHTGDGVFFLVGGDHAGSLEAGMEGTFKEEVQLGDRVFRRTLARFVILEVKESGARAKITARVDGFAPLVGSFVAPTGIDEARSGDELASVPLEPFRIVLAGGGGEGESKSLVVAVDLQVLSAHEEQVAGQLEDVGPDVRSAILGILLGLSRDDLARPDIRPSTAARVLERVNRLLTPAADRPETGIVRQVNIREWRIE